MNFAAVYNCLFGVCPGVNITIGKKDVFGIEFSAEGAIWTFSHGVSHGGTSNCPNPTRARRR